MHLPPARNTLAEGGRGEDKSDIQPLDIDALLAGTPYETAWIINPPSAATHAKRGWEDRAAKADEEFEIDRDTQKYLRTLIQEIHTVMPSTEIFREKSDVEDMLKRVEAVRTEGVLSGGQEVAVDLLIEALESYVKGNMIRENQDKITNAAMLCMRILEEPVSKA